MGTQCLKIEHGLHVVAFPCGFPLGEAQVEVDGVELEQYACVHAHEKFDIEAVADALAVVALNRAA